MNVEEFEALVVEAIEGIPKVYRDSLDNVEVVVEDLPDRWTMDSAGVTSPYQLLGFYHGIPKTFRTQSYNLVAPDKISIYRRPIMAQCRDDEEVRAMVHRVVRHEIAHYFGIDDDRLVEIGAY